MDKPEQNTPTNAPAKRLEITITGETWTQIEKAVNELNFVQSIIKYTPRLLVEELIEGECGGDIEDIINDSLSRVDAFIQKQREELKAKRQEIKERKK